MIENQQKMEEEAPPSCLWVTHSRWKIQVGASEGLNLAHVSITCASRKGPPPWLLWE